MLLTKMIQDMHYAEFAEDEVVASITLIVSSDCD